MLKTLATFVESIRTHGLLRQGPFEQLMTWVQSDGPDPEAIAKEIVKRGWLTAFQVKLVWKGRADELIFGQYILLDPIGEGGMGQVYRAKHRRMERIVALKIIRKERLNNPAAVKRFNREIQTAAQLAHENIVLAYDADQVGDRYFFAMEYIEGTNLAKLVKEKHPLPIELACDCIRQAAAGLQHAHERGMVHRDIKPSNLLLSDKGVLKILDMGLARLLETPSGDAESRITQEGLIVGTPDFLAPEQARNPREADIRADIYSLGCTFYYMLCGHAPYTGGTPTEKMLRHTSAPFPPLPRADVPPALVSIIERMMAKKPDDRFPTPAAVGFAVQSFQTGSKSLPRPAVEPLPQGLPAPPPPVFPTAGAFGPNAHVLPEGPGLEDAFRLPPPPVDDERPRERTRWNRWIALGVGVLVLWLLALGIRHFYVRNNQPIGPNLDKQVKNIHDMPFSLVVAGSFKMGSPDNEVGRSPDEGPQHDVKITHHYYISTTEVTLRQYFSVVGRYPRAYRDEPEDVNLPVAHISMRDVQAFLEKLNADPNSRSPGWEYRLPTEAEWEYACRAGTTTRFNTGNTIAKNQAHVDDADGSAPTKPESYPPNPWGIYDMHGNIAEWVGDYYDENFYAESTPDNPHGPERRRSLYVVRGGSYLDSADKCRSARRKGVKEETMAPDIGFRVVYAPVKK